MNERIVVPVMNDAGESSQLSEHFGRAPLFAIAEITADGEIGTLRFQRSKLHTRYSCPYPIDDPTTNHLEGINSFFKERLKLMKDFKRKDNGRLLIKLLVYYYRFHKFTSSRFKERNGKCPIELNQIKNQKYLDEILKGKEPYSWIRNMLSGP